ncbi:hypothetical protein CF15_03315 [Pyrodictium occultum]|uniref:Alpha-galactosidase NEW3 domain-containing protein n=1 Tax=Pyrodictium occultum TaxID=2309 RepID=A0A0V8RUU7_PYROC|nr:hypothetical protein [Pyrodictium occultum]KSW11844.1 hypothetical protein CF15_03315 [Pyrodictium occultum]
MHRIRAALVVLAAAVALLLLAPALPKASAAQAPIGFELIAESFTRPGGGPPIAGEDALLHIEWLHEGYLAADSVYAVISLPEGFSPQRLVVHLGPSHPGDILVVEKTVRIVNAAPGVYTANVTLHAVAGSASYEFNYTLRLQVSLCPPGLTVSARLTPFSYPGSNNVRLRVTLDNKGPGEVSNATLSIQLPRGWWPRGNESWSIDRLGVNESSSHEVTGVYVPAWVSPGVYYAKLYMDYYCTIDNTTRHVEYRLPLPIRVDEPEQMRVEPLLLGWAWGAAYPGEASTPIGIVLVNREPYTVTGLVAVLQLPQGMSIAGGSERVYRTALSNLAAGYGDTITLTPRVDVDGSLAPGVYNASLQLIFTVSWQGATTTLPAVFNFSLPVASPASLKAKILYAGWSDGYAYPGEVSAPLRVAVENLEDATVTDAVLTIQLPQGITWRGQQTARITAGNLAAGYGGVVELSTALDISPRLPPGRYTANATLVLVLRRSDNSVAVKSMKIPLVLIISPKRAERVEIVSARWATWVTGDKAYSATLDLSIGYWGHGTLRYLVVEARPLRGAALRAGKPSATVVQRLDLAPGDIASISIPGVSIAGNATRVVMALNVTAVISSPGGGVYNISARRIIELSPLREQPLRLGYVDVATAHLVPSSSNVEVDVGIANTAPEQVTILSASPGSVPGVEARLVGGDCLTAGVAPGSVCTLRLEVNVSSSARPGAYSVPLTIWYSYHGEAGTVVTGRQEVTVPLVVEPVGDYAPRLLVARAYPATAPGTAPVHVYPGDEAVPLQIEVYNPGRYQATGVLVRLKPLDQRVEVASQPQACNALAPGSSCTVTAYLRVAPGAQPGPHRLEVTISYIFTGFNAHVVVESRRNITLVVDDPNKAVYLLDAGWLYTPRPGTRTAVLLLRVYTDPSRAARISSIVVKLPPGLFNPQTGGDMVVAVPEAEALAQLPPGSAGGRSPGVNLERLLNRVSGAALAGEAEVYVAQVGVNTTRPGSAALVVDIAWVDQLGYLHHAVKQLEIALPMSPSIIEVRAPVYADLRGGVATVNVTLLNEGPSLVYNVYAVLAPVSTAGYVASSTRYLPVLEPGEPVNLTYRVVFNPASFGSSKSYTFTGLLTLVYEDAAGRLNTLNTSIAFIMRPSIILRFTQLDAEWHNGTLIIKGIIANEGVETAEAVRIEAYADGGHASILLGSLDPSSETPFRLELHLQRRPEEARITVYYSDSYGIVYSMNETLPVREAVPSNTPAAGKSMEARPPLSPSEVGGVAAVLAALAAVLGYVAYTRHHRLPGNV